MPHDQHRPARRARRRAARSTTSRRSSPTRPGTCSCSPDAARARCAQALRPRWARRRGRRAPSAWSSGSGADNVAVELSYAALPTDIEVNDALAGLAADAGLPTVATTAAHYATSERFPLATALAAVRARRSLDEADGWLPPAGTAHLRPGAEMARPVRHPPSRCGGAGGGFGAECAFTIDLVAPDLPPFETPPGITEAKWLRELTRRGVLQRYGSYAEYPEAVATVERELAVIEAGSSPATS